MDLEQKIVLLGSNGMLGHELQESFPNAIFFDYKVNGGNSKRVDISDYQDLKHVLEIVNEQDWVINAAAYTDVDGAETDEGMKQSEKVNVQGPNNLSELSKRHGFKVIHFSTAYVFDGKKGRYKEEDKTGPQNSYAIHKLCGEQFILGCDGIILRTDVLYGKYGKNFVDSIRNAAMQNEQIEVVNDQVGSPTSVKYLSKIVEKIVSNESSRSLSQKIYHATNSGRCSRSEFAREIIRLTGEFCDVKEITTEQYNKKYRDGKITAKRPADCSLDTSSLNELVSQVSWQEALKEYLFK